MEHRHQSYRPSREHNVVCPKPKNNEQPIMMPIHTSDALEISSLRKTSRLLYKA